MTNMWNQHKKSKSTGNNFLRIIKNYKKYDEHKKDDDCEHFLVGKNLFRTELSGIRPENLENAEDFKKVQGEVAEIIKDKIVVGHSIDKDMEALFLPHKAELLRDTSELFYKTDGKKYSLKELAKNELGISFQVRHQSISL